MTVKKLYYHRSLFNPKKENKLYKSYLTIIVMLIFLNGCTQNNQPPAWVGNFSEIYDEDSIISNTHDNNK